MKKKCAFLFPGQGAQYVGMGKDFFETFEIARHTLEEASDVLGKDISKTILEGPEDTLTETRNSQVAIFVVSIALLRVLKQQMPALAPHFCAGLSLGEYTALHASGKLDFAPCLTLVSHRGQFMNEACEATKGTMAAIIGLDAATVDNLVREINLPNDLWIANYNCPGQLVISGTSKGVEAGVQAAKAKGAKMVLPLQVHGAFHSGLMKRAEEKLSEKIDHLSLHKTPVELVMNVVGCSVNDPEQIKHNLVKQVTSSVRWEQSVRYMCDAGTQFFIEIGCGKTLTGFNKRIGVPCPFVNLDKVKDLEQISLTCK